MRKQLAIILLFTLIAASALYFSWNVSFCDAIKRAPVKLDQRGTTQTPKNPTRFTVFTPATAMLAVFGAYDDLRGGTLLPVNLTKTWEIKNATVLLSPLIANTYEESGRTKGVLAVQRQIVEGGEVEDAHAAPAEISVYVFSFNGNEWLFEKGEPKVIKAGSFGIAPKGQLVRIGDEKFGLLFEGDDMHHGYKNEYKFLVAISEPTIGVIFDEPTGEDNMGQCSDDEKERKESGILKLKPCWGYATKLSFIRILPSAYFIMSLEVSGTALREKDNAVVSAKRTSYLRMGSDRYKPIRRLPVVR